MFLVMQLYTVSQDGTLCVWESDTELDGLLKGPKYSERKKMEEERKRQEEKESKEDEDDEIEELLGEDGQPRGEVIKGSVDAPKEVEGIRNVRYKQKSKYVLRFKICARFCFLLVRIYVSFIILFNHTLLCTDFRH